MEKSERKEPELKKEVADKYELKGVTAGLHHVPKFGEINFSELDLAAADKLKKRGLPYLVEKEIAPVPDKADSPKKALPANATQAN
ncbi:hypothetical protein [Mucilaginibacter sp.]|uniref:hypothetical protein n=1 Tax=Mucilaginibacter sp. TaxID=1882438 RepID=UPI0035BBA57C